MFGDDAFQSELDGGVEHGGAVGRDVLDVLNSGVPREESLEELFSFCEWFLSEVGRAESEEVEYEVHEDAVLFAAFSEPFEVGVPVFVEGHDLPIKDH